LSIANTTDGTSTLELADKGYLRASAGSVLPAAKHGGTDTQAAEPDLATTSR
jgi:hypothetical protein